MILEELKLLPRTKIEADKMGNKLYFNGKLCSKGHIAASYAATYNCVECLKERNKLYSQNPLRKNQERKKSKKYRDSLQGKETLKIYESTEIRKRARKNTILKFQYGITLDKYEEMYKHQNGLCMICSIPMDSSTRRLSPCVDHDHNIGKVRGLICAQCNKGIANFKDNPIILQSAIRYLRRHSPIHS